MKTKKLFYRNFILAVILMFIFTSCENKKVSENPLVDTQWSGIAKVPMDKDVVLKFSKDRIDVVLEAKVIESMNYTMQENDIKLSKISGGSPCDAGAKGVYTYEMIGDKLTMTAVTDECVSRTKSLKGSVFSQIK